MIQIHITESGKLNPGLRTWKAHFLYEDSGELYLTGTVHATNNRALLHGALAVFDSLRNKDTEIQITSNSTYLLTSLKTKPKRKCANYTLRKQVYDKRHQLTECNVPQSTK